MNRIIKGIHILFFGAIIVACGGGSGGGSDPDPAIISANNENDLARAATSAIVESVAFEDTNQGGFGPALRSDGNIELRIPLKFAGKLAYAQPLDGFCEFGTASFDVNSDGTSGNFVYDQCVFFDITIDGTVIFESSTSGDVTTTTIEYVDFTTSFAGETQQLDFSAICTSNTATLETSCSFSSTVVGIDGRTYSVSDASVSGSDLDGYTISVTVEDPDHGIFSITTTQPITFNCVAGDQPDSGQIQFTDNEGTVVTVTYNDCSTFTVSYSGSSTVYNW